MQQRQGWRMGRRGFLQGVGCSLVAAPLLAQEHGLLSMPTAMVAEAATPSGLQLDVKNYGAVGDGVANDTVALQRTLDRCAVLGGGEVLVPAGKYLTGAIQLRSKVMLRLAQDAALIGSESFDDYPVSEVRWEGKWIPGHVALVYAFDAEDTGVVGPGTIVGNPALGGRPTKDKPLRHPALIEPIRCRRVKLDGFSTSYHLMWSVHPTECEDVAISNLTIRSTGGNGDGIDVDSCRRVSIDRCDISSGDDCISLKSGRGEEGYTIGKPTEDVTITNCTFADAIFACIGIGSETSAGIRRVKIRNCTFTGAKSHAIYIKSRPGRGPFLEDFDADGLDVSGVKAGFLRFNFANSGIQDKDPVPGLIGIPTAKNVRIANVVLHDCPTLVEGHAVNPEQPLDGFTLMNVSGTCKHGITLANMKHVVLKNIHVTGLEGPLLQTYNVQGKGLENAVAMAAPTTPGPVPEPAVPYKLQ